MLPSCIKEDVKIFTGATVVEFDAAVFNSATSGFTYPILTRAAGFGRAISTSLDPLITRASGTVRLRVNLVGPQSTSAETINYTVISTPVLTGTNQHAVSGTHFTTSGTTTIPANSSFAEITITIINPGTSSAVQREVHLELSGNATIKPSENYKNVAIRISQS